MVGVDDQHAVNPNRQLRAVSRGLHDLHVHKALFFHPCFQMRYHVAFDVCRIDFSLRRALGKSDRKVSSAGTDVSPCFIRVDGKPTNYIIRFLPLIPRRVVESFFPMLNVVKTFWVVRKGNPMQQKQRNSEDPKTIDNDVHKFTPQHGFRQTQRYISNRLKRSWS